MVHTSTEKQRTLLHLPSKCNLRPHLTPSPPSPPPSSQFKVQSSNRQRASFPASQPVESASPSCFLSSPLSFNIHHTTHTQLTSCHLIERSFGFVHHAHSVVSCISTAAALPPTASNPLDILHFHALSPHKSVR